MKKIFAIVLTAAALALAPGAGHAQTHIEKAIKTVSSSKSSREEVFSERRNPSNGQVLRISRVFTLSDNDADKIKRAFDNDRAKSVSYEFVRNEVYSIKFRTSNGGSASYQLLRNGRGWTFTVDIRPGAAQGRRVCWDEEKSGAAEVEKLLKNLGEINITIEI